jgi:hypothetical protein
MQSILFCFQFESQPTKLVYQSGFAALASVLIIGAVVTLIGVTVALTSISEGQSSLAGVKGANALSLVKGCGEAALLQINPTDTLPSSIVIPAGTCSVTTNSHVGNTWDFTVRASFDTYTKATNIVAVRGTTIDVTRWQELP